MTIADLLKKLPPHVRLALYVLAFLGLLGWGAWSAADGDWRVAIPKFLAALLNAVAAGNVTLPRGDDEGDDGTDGTV